MYKHINLTIPIQDSSMREKAVEWFKNVYIGTEIDLELEVKEDKDLVISLLKLYNKDKENTDFSFSDKAGCKLYFMFEKVFEKAFRTVRFKGAEANYTAREYFEFITSYPLDESIHFYIEDIQYLEQEDVDEEDKDEQALFYIGLEIGTEELSDQEFVYKIRKPFEDKLALIYDDIFGLKLKSIFDRKLSEPYDQTVFDPFWFAIPLFDAKGQTFLKEERLHIITKMFISLKGRISFAYVGRFTFRKEMIIKEKYKSYPYAKGVESELIDEPIYDFPRDWTVKDTIRWMGDFTEELSRIRLCPDNIVRAAQELMGIQSFRRKIMKPLRQVASENREYDSEKMYLSMILESLVFTHECGHFVFRNIRETLNVTQHETLANWFSTLVCGQWGRMFVVELIPLCPEEYQKFLPVPNVKELTGRKYTDYCKNLLELLKGW